MIPKYSSDEMIIRMIFDIDLKDIKPKMVNTIVKYIPMLVNKYHQKLKFHQEYRDNFIRLSEGIPVTYLSFIYPKLEIYGILPKSNGYLKSFNFLMGSEYNKTKGVIYKAYKVEFSRFCFNYINKLYPDYLKSIQDERLQSS